MTDRRSIDRLFGAGGLARFRRERWPDEVFVHHAPAELVDRVLRCEALRDIDAFFDSKPPRLRAWFTTGRSTHQAIDIASGADAKAAFHGRNMTLVANSVHGHIPEIQALLDELADGLGIPRDRMSCNAYVSPAGRGARLHFDNHEVIVLHLLGRKRWGLLGNPYVKYPSWGWPGGRVEPTSRLAPQLARAMPDDERTLQPARFVVLRRGSVLALPRGTFHTTTALADSLALTIAPTLPAWHQIVMHDLTRLLDRRPEWRCPVPGILADPAERDRVRDEYRTKLRELGRMLLDADPDELHEPFRGGRAIADSALLRPASRRAVTFDAGTLVLDGPGGCTELEVDGGYASWCRWFAGRRTGVSLQACLQRDPRLEPAAIRHIVGIAMSNGALIAATQRAQRRAAPGSSR